MVFDPTVRKLPLCTSEYAAIDTIRLIYSYLSYLFALLLEESFSGGFVYTMVSESVQKKIIQN